MPSFIGLSAKEAKNRALQAGLQTKFLLGGRPPSKEKALTVAAQNLKRGTVAAKGTAVELTLYSHVVSPANSKDPSIADSPAVSVTVPDLVGRSAADAKAVLLANGLVAEFRLGTAAPSHEKSLAVYAQDPQPGTLLTKGSTVGLTIYAQQIATADSAADRTELQELTRAVLSSVLLLNQNGQTIDPRSGRLLLAATDLEVPAGATNLVVRRFLQLQRMTPGLLGTRWRLNWEKRLVHRDRLALITEGPAFTVFQYDSAAGHLQSSTGDHLVFQNERAIRTTPDGDREVFDADGRLIERNDRNGNKVVLHYDPDGQLARVEGPCNTFLLFVTDDNKQLHRIKSSTGASVRYSYGDQPIPSEHGDDACAVAYTYDAGGSLARIAHPKFGTTEFTYDSRGRVRRRSWLNRGDEYFRYIDSTNTQRHIDPGGRMTVTEWSPDKRKAETTDWLGRKHATVFDEAGRPVEITDTAGRVTRFTCDALGRTIKIETPDDRTMQFKYASQSALPLVQIAADGSRTTFDYDSRLNLLEIRAGSQPIYRMTYYSNGLLKTLGQWGRPESHFDYDDSGRLTAIRDALGNPSRFEYDQRGNLVRSINPLGHVTTWTYDGHDRLLSHTDFAGQTTRYDYTPQGQLAAVTDAAGGVTRFEYDSHSWLLSRTDPDGLVSRNEYDPRGRLVKSVTPDGQEVAYTYDPAGNLIELNLSSGAVWSFSYDEHGRLVCEEGPLGHKRRIRYDSAGRVAETRDALDRKTEYSYDKLGRLVALRGPSDSVQQLEYDADGRLAASVDALGRRVFFEYDQYGRISGVSRGTEQLLRYDYTLGRVSRVDGPADGSISYSYDQSGCRTGRLYANGEQYRFSYNALGKVVEAADALGNAWQAAYTPTGRLARFTTPSGSAYSYTYTPLGRLQSIVDPLGRSRRYQYDSRGRRIAETDSLGRTSKVTYGPGSRFSAVIAADGQTTRFEYDMLGRVKQINYPAGPPARFRYDSVGNLLEEEYGPYHAHYRYDVLDRLVEASYQPAEQTIQYLYDEAGRRVAMEVAGIGRWTYEYDDKDRLIELRDPRGGTTHFQYDDAARVIRQVLPNGVTIARSYDARGRWLRMVAKNTAGDVLVERTYQHNEAGNLVKETRSTAGEIDYEYDSEDRLIGFRQNGAEEQFMYDAVGNRSLSDDRAEYDAADQLVRFRDEAFTYNDRGAMILRRRGDTRVEYVYDPTGRMTAVEENGETIAQYGYDTRGRRIWKKTGGTTTHYVYDGNQLLLEVDGTARASRAWIPGVELDRPVGFISGDTAAYPITDSVGSVVALTDHTGKVTHRWDHGPFGHSRSAPEVNALGTAIPYGFAGGHYDSETGLYYFRQRYYDQTLGRFLTPDPVLGQLANPPSLHPYQYCYNNPLRYRDPMGTTAWDMVSSVVDSLPVGSDIADGLTNAAGSIGHTVGYYGTKALTTIGHIPIAVLPIPQEDKNAIWQKEDEFARHAGGVAVDTLASTATSIVTDPIRLGSASGDIASSYEQGRDPSGWELGGAALAEVGRALPLAGKAAQAVKAAGRSVTAASARLARNVSKPLAPDLNALPSTVRDVFKADQGAQAVTWGGNVYRRPSINPASTEEVLSHEGFHVAVQDMIDFVEDLPLVGNRLGDALHSGYMSRTGQALDEFGAFTTQLVHAHSRGVASREGVSNVSGIVDNILTNPNYLGWTAEEAAPFVNTLAMGDDLAGWVGSGWDKIRPRGSLFHPEGLPDVAWMWPNLNREVDGLSGIDVLIGEVTDSPSLDEVVAMTSEISHRVAKWAEDDSHADSDEDYNARVRQRAKELVEQLTEEERVRARAIDWDRRLTQIDEARRRAQAEYDRLRRAQAAQAAQRRAWAEWQRQQQIYEGMRQLGELLRGSMQQGGQHGHRHDAQGRDIPW